MPRNRSMQLYLVRFSLADGEHLAGAYGMKATNEKQLNYIKGEILRGLNPATPENPDGNPGFNLTEVRPVDSDAEITKAKDELYRANPNRVGLEQLGLDTPNRALHQPEITQKIAADNTPG